MSAQVITSQPTSTNQAVNINTDQPPSYEEVISAQPCSYRNEIVLNPECVPDTLTNSQCSAPIIGDNSNLRSDENLTSTPAEAASEDEETKERNHRRDDCCFVCIIDDECHFFLCRWFANCCYCLGDCCDTCFEDCASCLHNCCETNTEENSGAVDARCCGDGEDVCCSCNGNDSNDCDCDCW